ncbi:CBS domain-containing protein [Desulfolucanica intricata]|uniref:CBS domain-containing protein n=1 Tax=Desulfolucanica intricata TaxID=1285191 RepID=UPI00083631A3|nr:CBS domain-containing protein [Desulfolucanica intricata]
MTQNRSVQSIMVPKDDYPVIKQNVLISKAINILRSSFHKKDGTWFGFQSLVVLNNKEIPVGILTLRGLLKALKMQATGEHIFKDRFLNDFYFSHYIDDSYITVKDIMRPINLITIQKDSSIFDAVLIIVKKRINSLPVMDGKKLVGIVRTIDLFWSVGDLLE